MNNYLKKTTLEATSERIPKGIVHIVLKFKDGFENTWRKNVNNSLKFEQMKKILTSNNHTCYFQKQKSDANNNRSRHKIIIPIENEKAIELGVGLWSDKIDAFTEVFSYLVSKGKEIPFLTAPIRDTFMCTCSFQVVNLMEKQGIQPQLFQNIYETIEKLNIPIADINKEKDQRIWKNYVLALKKLVKQKEQVWKIDNISKPYTENNIENERSTYIDIYINETDLNKHFENELKDYFKTKDLEDYGINEERAFIEFKTFRELAQEEREKLNNLASEYFYDISINSPTHYISGEFCFKYIDFSAKDEIFSQLKNILSSDYQIEIDIDDNGYLNISEIDYPHVKKVISDNFETLLELKQDNSTLLKVQFENTKLRPQIIQQIKYRLNEQGLTRADVRFSDNKQQVIIDVSSFLRNDIFTEFNLFIKERIYRFGSKTICKLEQIPGCEIVNNEYHTKNIKSKEESKDILNKIQNKNGNNFFRQLPTRYILETSQDPSIEELRNFKTETDSLGKTTFDISRSIIKIDANSNTEYISHIDRIKKKFPYVIIEKKDYKPTFYLQFETDLEVHREKIITQIQNVIRNGLLGKVEFDVLKNHTRVLFSYDFKNEKARDNFKQIVIDACIPYQNLLDFSFENSSGRTIYEFIKNEILELEKEREVVNNVRQATFIFLTPDEYSKLTTTIKSTGDDSSFREGKPIGTLIRKDREKLKFRITDYFDDLLNANENERLALEEIKKGYIKPIFPGELTNISRMIKAMKKVTEPNNKVGFPANRNLSNFLFDPNTARQSSEDIEEEKKKVLQNLNEPLLKNQPKQLEAVAKSLLAKDIALIQGPPGTGKTTVIAEIIWQTLLREPDAKILITSQTNLAVDNALERLKGKKLVRPIRIGNIEKFEDEGKVYSDKRLKDWLAAKPDSDNEKAYSDNAICEWIKSIGNKCSEDVVYHKAVTKWKNGLNNKDSLIKTTFSNKYLKFVNVFAATCSECGSRNFSETYQTMFQKNKEIQGDPEFDLVIMDEASKATPPELVLPLTLGKKVIIIGDHKQLPPMIDENEFSEALAAVGAKQLVENWTKDDYKTSQFEKLFVNAPKNFVTSLDTQFRMHEQIMECISQFYKDQEELENGLICGIKDKMDIADLSVKASRWHGFNFPPFIDPSIHALWVNVETPEKKVGTSYENEGEIEAIKIVLRALIKSDGFNEYFKSFNKEEDKEIGIITYYMPQMQKIRNTIYPSLSKRDWRNFELHKYENEFQIPFRINTVDRFQGMERNIILISTVRSNRQIDLNGREQQNIKYPFALGFARELQRVNVGFSRAKRLLIVIGNEKHFANKTEYAEAIQKMHRIDIAQLQNL